MEKEIASGRVVQTREGQVPRQVRYLDEQKGKTLNNIWIDIPAINSQANERTGSPDQKPLALYGRIIRASSNEGDLVLDPFAGCATTPIAAHNLGRRWVGIDRREDAAFHITNRLLGLGINVDEFKAQQQHLIPELQGKCEIRYEAPVRTDSGETAGPGLTPVLPTHERSVLTHQEMKDFLTEQVGLTCWGCNFTAPDARYLELDHVTPKSDGGSNHLDNRALLCKPCNLAKSNRKTLSQLRRDNMREGHWPEGRRKRTDDHPVNLQEVMPMCRAYLEERRARVPYQRSMENLRMDSSR